ncbi:MAG: 3-oxoacyl-ACP synthase III [Planctomycetota bacterium]|nr:3-oxoacyl-ACP synthase III [Planctomycetota bacterium]
MRYSRVHLSSLGYELAPVVVTSDEIEERLKPLYDKLHMSEGQLEALTGISERRWWEPDYPLSHGATLAAERALERAGVPGEAVEVVIYAGVCRESFEPATACRIAAGIGVHPAAGIYDISNACLGVMNGIFEIANRIELGQIRAGLVVSAETAREIVEITIERMLGEMSMEYFTKGLATLTGGSGAVAVLLTDGSFGNGHRLVGGAIQAAPEHHDLCRWSLGGATHLQVPGPLQQDMYTDSAPVLQHGVELGKRNWRVFLDTLGWTTDDVDRVICHQVGGPHRDNILRALGLSEERDFSTFAHLGNIGTVSLPITAAIADEREILVTGHRVAFLGIGSGLNCLMLGWEW